MMEADRERVLLLVLNSGVAKQMGPIGFNFIGYVYYALAGFSDSYGSNLNRRRRSPCNGCF